MKRAYWTALPVLLAIAPASYAQSVGYEEALRAAASEQPALEAGELRIAARREAAEAADELPDPRLRAGIMNLPVTGPDAFDPTMMTMLQLGIEQEIPNLAKRRAREGLASSDARLAEAQLGLTTRELRIAAGTAWIDLAYAQRRLDLAAEAEAEFARFVPVAIGAVAADRARPAESLEIRRAIIELQDMVTALEAEREAAQARLERYLPASGPTATGPAPSPIVEPRELRLSLERNPELQLSAAEIERAEAQLRVAEADRRPDFGIDVSYGRRDPEFGDVVSVMGSVTLPIFAGRRQEPRIAAAEAEAAASLAAREDRRRRLVAEFEADLAGWRSAYRQWQRARDELLPLARDGTELEIASFKASRAELTDLIDALTARALVELEVLKREAEAVKAAAMLRLTYEEDVE